MTQNIIALAKDNMVRISPSKNYLFITNSIVNKKVLTMQ